jgi:copper chaperone CopZ
MTLPAASKDPQIVHTLPGRVRVHLPGWSGRESRWLEMALGRLPGVQAVQVNPVTRNALVRYDPSATGISRILAALAMWLAAPAVWAERAPGTADAVDTLGVSSERRAVSRAVQAPRPAHAPGTPAHAVGPIRRPATSAALPEVTRTVRPVHDAWQLQSALNSMPHHDYRWARSLPRAHPLLDMAHLALKAVGVILTFLSAGSPIGLALGCVEALQLLVELRARRFALVWPPPPTAEYRPSMSGGIAL